MLLRRRLRLHHLLQRVILLLDLSPPLLRAVL